ncbi:MAG: M28 family peptidase [bacterium]|nr:M28 family peptidase [bacterium]
MMNKQLFNKATKQCAQEILEYTDDMVNEFPERLVGTPGCRKSAEAIKNDFEKNCDPGSVKMEEFNCNPKSFLAFTRTFAVTFTISMAALWAGGLWIILSAASFLYGIILGVVQFVFYKTAFDPLFKKVEGVNVSGVIEPEGTVKQQIILSGHHDSPYEFSLLRPKVQKWYAPRVIIAAALYYIGSVFAFIFLYSWITTGAYPSYAAPVKYGFLIAFPIVFQYYFFYSRKHISPGAGDNMIACAMAVKLSEVFSRKNNKGKSKLKHTRLIFLTTDGEEAGLRGARDYCKKHKNGLQDVKTYVFNMDSLYNYDQIQFATNDLNCFQKLSEDMAQDCVSIAKDLGHHAELFPFVFGGGGTDAAEFAAIGVEATTVIAMPTNITRNNFYYHTRYDTVDKIEPEVVEATFDIACEYIMRKDKAV